MKRIICLAVGLLAFTLTPVFAQYQPQPPINPQTGLPEQSTLTKFNLNFPGGTPAELVKAIEKAMGKPLNVIIPPEDEDVQLPSLKMNNVEVPQLFQALQEASATPNRYGPPGSTVSQYGFQTRGTLSDNSIWYFYVKKSNLPPPPQKDCQFYNLDPYLNRGFTVDDITTVIQTGWKMMGVNPAPELDYHKETKMLIAFGERIDLQMIDRVLSALPKSSISVPTAKAYNDKIRAMQSQIDELKAKLKEASAHPTGGVPEEKSGK